MKKETVKIISMLTILVGFVLLLQACSDGEVSSVGNVEGIVKDAETGLPIQGARVKIAETTDTTANDGVYTLYNIDIGNRTMSVVAPDYDTYTTTISVNENTTVLHEIVLSKRTRKVSGIVIDAETALPIKDVTVTIGTTQDITTENGAYTLPNIDVGQKTVTAIGENYQPYTGTVEVQSGVGTSFDIQMHATQEEIDPEQIVITYPANNSVASELETPVKADIPESAGVKEVVLFVDGIEVGIDADGAPWEIPWPSYYWGDGNTHSLLLKARNADGKEIRSSDQHQVMVSTQTSNDLRFAEGVDGLKVKDTNTVSVNFDKVSSASGYDIEILSGVNTQTKKTETTTIYLTDLDIGQYSLRYRATIELSDQSQSLPVYGVIQSYLKYCHQLYPE